MLQAARAVARAMARAGATADLENDETDTGKSLL
jgi:hypothetical protein